MMVNAVAALTGAAYDPAHTVPTAEGESGDFAAALENQQALLPLLVGGAQLEGDAPVDAALADAKAPDEEKPEDALAALWLTPQPAVAPAALNDAVLAAASPLSASAAPDEAVAPNGTAGTRAVADMLRMIAGPQASLGASTPASAAPQAQTASAQNESLFIFTPPTAQNSKADEREPAVALEFTTADSRQQAQTISTSLTSAPAPVVAHAPASTPATVAAPPVSTPLPTPTAHAALEPEVGSPAWKQALSHQLTSFTRNGVHHAELRLHPEELGPLQISLRLHQDQAQLHFVTDHHQVRAALEAAMPHLRSSLAEAGIQLDQGSVGSEAPSWGATADSGSGHASHSQQEGESAQHAEPEEDPAPRMIVGRPGISIFA